MYNFSGFPTINTSMSWDLQHKRAKVLESALEVRRTTVTYGFAYWSKSSDSLKLRDIQESLRNLTQVFWLTKVRFSNLYRLVEWMMVVCRESINGMFRWASTRIRYRKRFKWGNTDYADLISIIWIICWGSYMIVSKGCAKWMVESLPINKKRGSSDTTKFISIIVPNLKIHRYVNICIDWCK